jgi:hypothetical protein
MLVELADIWTVAGVLLGFQVSSFVWRLSREISVGESNHVTWLPPADIVNLVSMIILVIGVFVVPILGILDSTLPEQAFGLALLLFVGYPFAIAGHYDMYNKNTDRSVDADGYYVYFTFQEKLVVVVIALVAIAYVITAIVGQ